MKNSFLENVMRIPIGSTVHIPRSHRSPRNLLMNLLHSSESSRLKQNKAESVITKNNKRTESLTVRIRNHVSIVPKITETVKGKLSWGAKILKVGGVAKLFKQNFSCNEGEKLLKVFQCYLSTTAGPIAGLMFISTDKIAFHSERSMKISSPAEEEIRFHYKVSIPLEKIKAANESRNIYRPSRKYLDIVTIDDFDFWFMGFINYNKSFLFLQQAISQHVNP